MKRYTVLFLLLAVGMVTMVGCATVQQAKQDAEVGLTTPLEAGEVSPQQQAQQAQAVASAIPFVGPYANLLGPLFIGFFAWKRGKGIRAKMPVSSNPITGAFGPKIGVGSLNLESIVQTVSDLFKGAYEVGPDGSGLKRGWKNALNIILAGIGAFFLVPGAKEFILNNQNIVGTITILAAAFGAVEKKLADVRPVVLPPAPPTT